MNDDVETETKTKPGRPSLTLRRQETKAVKQSFSHGRSKTVVVETRRRRALPAKKGETPDSPPTEEPAAKPVPAKPAKSAPKQQPASRKPGAVLKTLSDGEKNARARALARAYSERDAREKQAASELADRLAREAEERARLEAERKRLQAEEDRRTREAAERKRAEEEAGRALEEEERIRKERAAAKAALKTGRPGAEPETPSPSAEADNPLAQLGGRLKVRRKVAGEERRDTRTRDASRRRAGKLTIANALDDEERQRSLASVKRAREREKIARRERGESTRVVRDVTIPETITVQELASRMSMRAVDLVKELMKQGQMVTANAVLDADTAQLVAEDLGHSVNRVADADVEEGLDSLEEDPADLSLRPPVVTVMGHVDHGKTSLLDAMRKTDVATGEAGGITQHIGAYQIHAGEDRKITFLDTPGHAAFTQMRSRGAQVTDIVVLVVAADDSVMPQTEEAVSHARAAGVPVIVAINKIDRPEADPDKVRTDLLRHEIQVESLGGDIQDVEVSALAGTNLDGLQEAILLQADLLELKSNPDRPAQGTIVESRLEKSRGAIVSLLVRKGTLKRGDILIAGSEWGKVRAMMDCNGNRIDEAGPSFPVEVLGLNGAPDPGDEFHVVNSESRAREIAQFRQRREREKQSVSNSGASLEQMMAQLQDAEIRELPVVIKGDVRGSIEAVCGSLEKLSTDEVRIKILHTGVGGISESDVILAAASSAPVIGFNVRANRQARQKAEQSGVEIRYYSVIYNLIDDIRGVLGGMLKPEIRETFLGNAEILEVFTISGHGKVAGCRVTEGLVRRGANVRLVRDSIVIHEGELSQLKRFKDDVREVTAGQECGMSFLDYADLKAGDTIECFQTEKITRSL